MNNANVFCPSVAITAWNVFAYSNSNVCTPVKKQNKTNKQTINCMMVFYDILYRPVAKIWRVTWMSNVYVCAYKQTSTQD